VTRKLRRSPTAGAAPGPGEAARGTSVRGRGWVVVGIALALGVAAAVTGVALLSPRRPTVDDPPGPATTPRAAGPAQQERPAAAPAADTGHVVGNSGDAGAQVTLEVRPRPASARVMIDGRLAGIGRVRIVLSRSSAPVTIEVSARGHGTSRQRLVPDRDRTLTVELQPTPSAPRDPLRDVDRNPYRPR